MTSILKESDKIFNMYKQYKELIYNDAKLNNDVAYGIDQLASRMTVAHMLDHVVCLFKKDESPIVRKVNKTWEKKFGDGVEGKEELEIMLNNAQITSSTATSSSADVEINDWWGRRG